MQVGIAIGEKIIISMQAVRHVKLEKARKALFFHDLPLQNRNGSMMQDVY